MADRDSRALAADIAAAYCVGNRVAVGDLPAFVASVVATLDGLGKAAPVRQPAVAIRDSVKPDYIVCLEDGRKLKVLRGHLRSAYNLTPDQYRARWGLRHDYPMVAATYSTARSQLALARGLGRRRNPAPAAITLVGAAPPDDHEPAR